MIGHQDVGMNAAIETLAGRFQLVQIEQVIDIIRKYYITVIAPLNDVLWVSRKNKSWLARHCVPPCTWQVLSAQRT
jgi:hypothetical protein